MGRSVTLEQRVVRAAESALAERGYVCAIDVLTGVGWLHASHVDAWRQGRIDCLERVAPVHARRLSDAMAILRRFAQDRGLVPSETEYLARARDRRPLRFGLGGDGAAERAYRTHWVSPELPEAERERLRERRSRVPELVVVSPIRDWTCAACEGTGDLLLMEERGPICMRCADRDHLVLLPAGDAALTRRARRASRLSAVVVRFSRSRKRYERQGILVEEGALERAERECLADEDAELQARMAGEIARLFPGCPAERAQAIAGHTAARGSGRVGRTSAGRALDAEAIALAVTASVRQEDTRYDELVMSGVGRDEARHRIRSEVERVLERWRRAPAAGAAS